MLFRSCPGNETIGTHPRALLCCGRAAGEKDQVFARTGITNGKMTAGSNDIGGIGAPDQGSATVIVGIDPHIDVVLRQIAVVGHGHEIAARIGPTAQVLDIDLQGSLGGSPSGNEVGRSSI